MLNALQAIESCPDKGMHWADIICRLSKSGISQTQIAHEENTTRQAVYQVIRRKSKSQKIARAIATHTGLSIRTLFGNSYEPQYETELDYPHGFNDE